MIYDLSHPITDRTGRGVADASGPVTLATAIISALDNVTPANERTAGVEKMRRYRLGCRILSDPVRVDLTLEEAALCKSLVGEGYGPLIVGQVWSALEGQPGNVPPDPPSAAPPLSSPRPSPATEWQF